MSVTDIDAVIDEDEYWAMEAVMDGLGDRMRNLQAEIEKLREVIGCVNNNCKRRDTKIAALQAENAMNEKLLNATLDVVKEQKAEIACLRDALRKVFDEFGYCYVCDGHEHYDNCPLKSGEE